HITRVILRAIHRFWAARSRARTGPCRMTAKTTLKLDPREARKKRWKLPLFFILGLVCSTVSAAVKITDLGTLGGEWSMALDINDSDQVICESSLSGDQG